MTTLQNSIATCTTADTTWNDLQYMKGIQQDIERAEQEAARLGTIAGQGAAAWVEQDTWGGRVTRGEKEAAAAFLHAYDEGDFSAFPEPPNLSGEWAGDETPQSLMETLLGEDWQDVSEYVDAQDDICRTWEDAASESFLSALVESAQSIVS